MAAAQCSRRCALDPGARDPSQRLGGGRHRRQRCHRGHLPDHRGQPGRRPVPPPRLPRRRRRLGHRLRLAYFGVAGGRAALARVWPAPGDAPPQHRRGPGVEQHRRIAAARSARKRRARDRLRCHARRDRAGRTGAAAGGRQGIGPGRPLAVQRQPALRGSGRGGGGGGGGGPPRRGRSAGAGRTRWQRQRRGEGVLGLRTATQELRSGRSPGVIRRSVAPPRAMHWRWSR